MKKKDRQEVGNYVRGIADLMGLRDWEFRIDFDAGDERESNIANMVELAYVEPSYGRKLAHLHLHPDLRDMDPNQIRMIVAHEMVHCHLAAVQDQCEDDLEKVLGMYADILFHKAFRRNLEYAVDGIATAWAEMLPLIEWPA